MKTIRKPYTEEDRTRLYKAAYRFAKNHGLEFDEDEAAEEFEKRHGYDLGGPPLIIANIAWEIYHAGDTMDRKLEAAWKRVFCRAVRIPYKRDAFIYGGMVISP